MKKDLVLNSLDSMILFYKNSNDITRAERLKVVKRLVKRANIEDYKNITTSKNGINVGYIMEDLVLNYLGLECEDNMHEIKSLIINTPNILKNDNVKVVYIVIISKYFNGLYRLDNASKILNIRFGINEFRELKNELVKVCELNDLVKA
jgi:hypothetical protein